MENSALSKKRIFSISEAATLLQVSTKTLRRWEKATGVKAARTKGGQRRYTKSQLDVLLKAAHSRHDPSSSPSSRGSSAWQNDVAISEIASASSRLRNDVKLNARRYELDANDSLTYLYTTAFRLLGKALLLTAQRVVLGMQVAYAIGVILFSLLLELLQDPFFYRRKLLAYSTFTLVIVVIALLKNILL